MTVCKNPASRRHVAATERFMHKRNLRLDVSVPRAVLEGGHTLVFPASLKLLAVHVPDIM